MRSKPHTLIGLLLFVPIASAACGLAADQVAQSKPEFSPDGKIYKLVHVATGKVLGVTDDSEQELATIELQTDENNETRQWTISKQDGFIKILNHKSHQSLDVQSANIEAGANIILYRDKSALANGGQFPGGLDNQLWSWEGDRKQGQIKSKLSNLVFDITDDGKVVQRKADPQSKSQLWRLVAVDDSHHQQALAANTVVDATALALPVLHLANGDFAAGQLLDCADPKTIRWQNPAFTKAIDFKLQSASGIHFPVANAGGKPAGDFGVELLGGDMLYGSLAALTKDTLALDVSQLGLVHIERDQVCRLERRRESSEFVYFGPNGLQNWTQPDNQKQWREEAGELVADAPGAAIQADVGMPPKSAIELDVSWKAKADFAFILGAAGSDDKSLRRCFRIEAWDGHVVAMFEIDQEADLVDLQDVKPGAGHLHLQMYFDQQKGRLLVYSSSGKQLADLYVHGKFNPQPGTSVRLTNNRGDVRLERLRITTWNGEAPHDLPADQGRLQLANGKTIDGEIQEYDPEHQQFLVRSTKDESHGGEPIRIDADRLSTAVLAAQKDTPATDGIRVVANGGLRLSGKLENIAAGKLKLTRAGIQEPLLVAVNQLQSLVVLNPSVDEDDTANRIGRLELDGFRLHGYLVNGQKSPDASCLDWRPVLATSDSPLKNELSGRIVYRDPPPPAPKVISAPTLREAVQQPAPPGLWDGFMKAYSTDGPGPGGTPTLHLRTGDSIPLKRITHIDTDGVSFESSATDAKFVPHEKIKAIELAKEVRTIPLDKTKRDRLLTLPRMQKNNPPTQLIVSTNGDYLRGRLVEMTDKTVSVEVHLETREIPRANIARIVWLHEDEITDNPANKTADKSADKPGPTDKPLDKTDGNSNEKLADRSTDKSTDKVTDRIGDEIAAKPVSVPPDLLIQTLRNDGDRMTFSPKAVAHETLSGKSDILGGASIDLKQIDQILIGKAIEENAALLSYNRWKLHSAIEPLYVQEDEAGGADHPAGTQSALVGKPAPDFELNLLDGGKFRVSQQKGKVLVLDFFATWCGPCVGAMPQVEAAVDELKDRSVKLVAVNMQEDSKTIQSLLERLNLKPTVALDRDGVAAEKYAVTAIPQTVIIGPDGNVARLFIGGGPDFGDQLRQALKETLDGPNPSTDDHVPAGSSPARPATPNPAVAAPPTATSATP